MRELIKNGGEKNDEKPQYSRGGGVSSPLISSELQKKSKRKAFSVAEAMVTLTIFAVVAASAAPLISKQIKSNSLSDVAFSTLSQKIEKIDNIVKNLDTKALWTLAGDKISVYRVNGNVGIGTASPEAKLDISLPEMASTVSGFKVRKGTKKYFEIDTDGRISIGERKDGKGTTRSRVTVNYNGQMSIWGPKREETNPEANDYDTRNDTRAFTIYYPSDSDSVYDSVGRGDNITDMSNDGYTEVAFFNSNGSLYINSINNAASKEALAIRNGVIPVAYITSDGQLRLQPKDTVSDGFAFDLVPINEKGVGFRKAYITRDGSAYFKGNVESAGSASFKSLSVDGKNVETALDTLNNELKDSKKLIAELKSENEVLKEKLVMFEAQMEQVLAQQNMEKIAQKRPNKLFK